MKVMETVKIEEKKESTAVYKLMDGIPLGAYFWRMVANKLVDRYRQKRGKEKPEQATDPIDLEKIAGSTNGHSDNPAFELLEILEKEDPDLETLVRLHHYVGMPYKEIAESGMTRFRTEGSCKKATMEARNRLIEIAKNQGVYAGKDKKEKEK
jgi:DNA-directed RNA polymerase specialized sigma24 family protein